MYVYSINYNDYDIYSHLVLQSKVKYTRQQLYEILFSVLYEVYDKDKRPPIPCLLSWEDIIFKMKQEPYKTFLREQYFLVPFDFDLVVNLGPCDITNDADNIYCRRGKDNCLELDGYICRWKEE